jgi:hypothetical protein
MPAVLDPLDDYERGYASAEELVEVALWSVGLKRALNMADHERRGRSFPVIGSDDYRAGRAAKFEEFVERHRGKKNARVR